MKINVIHMDRTSPTEMHKFCNFAEDVWFEYRDNRRVEVDLDVVDHGSTILAITSQVGFQGRITTKLHQLIRKHMLEALVKVQAGSDRE